MSNDTDCDLCSKLEVALPDIDYIEIPAGWWDAEADKSLLIGVHKHGKKSMVHSFREFRWYGFAGNYTCTHMIHTFSL